MKKITFLVGLIFSLSIFNAYSQVWSEVSKTLPFELNNAVGDIHFGYSVDIDGDYAVVGARDEKSKGAAYVYHNSGLEWELVNVLVASDAANSDRFGCAVGISGDYIVVGAEVDDDNGNNSGSAYIFKKPATGWKDATQVAKLTASDGSSGDYFGSSVRCYNDVVVIGAYHGKGKVSNSGAVYVFEKPASGWATTTETAKLTASDGADGDYFGYSVSVFADYIVVGAPFDDDDANASGAVYVFKKTGTKWTTTTEVAKLNASDASINARFGASVDIYDDNCIVAGAYYKNSGDGAVYVFSKNSVSEWKSSISEIEKLTLSSANSRFGYSVRVLGDKIVAGTGQWHHRGSVYVFQKTGASWANTTEIAKLTAATGQKSERLGASVCISDDYIMSGTFDPDDYNSEKGSVRIFKKPESGWTTATETQTLTPNLYPNNIESHYGSSVSVDGNYAVIGSSDQNLGRGCAYVLHNNGSKWEKVATLTASDNAADDNFGASAAIKGDYIVVGATFENNKQGAVYIFEKPASGWTTATETKKIVSSNRVNNNLFGKSVDIFGNLIVVGEPYSDNNGHTDNGAAYIFEKQGNNWVQIKRLVKSIGTDNDKFGYSVSISENYLAVSSPEYDASSPKSGSVYIYHKSSDWSDTPTMIYPKGVAATNYYFGSSISTYDDNTIVIGAPGAKSSTNRGYAYVFKRTGTNTWEQKAELSASDGASGNKFGGVVNISDNTIIVSALAKNMYQGVVYIFEKPNSGWATSTETSKIIASDAAKGDHFGISVGVSNGYAIIGASKKDGNDMESGCVYIYTKKVGIIKEPDNQTDKCLGAAVEFSVSAKNVSLYQWQVNTGSAFEDIADGGVYSNTTGDTLKISAVTIGMNNNQYRCIISNDLGKDTTVAVNLILETKKPTISCIANKTVISGSTGKYKVEGTEFDPVSTSDNCSVANVKNDFNNLATLANAEFPKGTTTVVWTVTDKSNNTNTCSFKVVVKSPSGVEELKESGILIYPNPTNGVVNVRFSDNKSQKLTISDATGRVIFEKEQLQASETIDLSSSESGIYFVTLQTDEKSVTSKIILK